MTDQPQTRAYSSAPNPQPGPRPITSLVPPYSEEAEEAVIGSVLVNPEAFLTVASFLKAEDFYLIRHAYVWGALERLNNRSEPIDYLTLVQELKDMGWLNDIGGPGYITRLVNNTPTSMHAEFYGRIVERTALRRRLMTTADEIKALALDETMDIDSVVNTAETRLFSVTDRQLKREFVPMHDAVSEYFDRIEHLMQSQTASFGVPSGFRKLDELLGGFQRSDLLIFAGRPGMGKTSFLLSAATNAARLGGRIAIFTMEMGADQIVQRIVAMETGINTQKLRLGQLNQQEYARFVEAAGRIARFPIFIDDTPALSPIQMRTKCRRLQHEYGIDMVIVDYMQLMNAGGTYQNNRVQEISYISRALKELARELNVPIFSAAQLSRAVEQRQDKRPVLSDLRESGCLSGESRVWVHDEGRYVPIRDLAGRSGFRVLSVNPATCKLEVSEVSNAFSTGVKPVYRLTTQLGRSIRATGNHQFLTIHGWKRLDELTSADRIALPRERPEASTRAYAQGAFTPPPAPPRKQGGEKSITRRGDLAPSSVYGGGSGWGSAQYAVTAVVATDDDLYWDSIAAIVPDGEVEVFDLTVPGNSNFLAEDIVVHNSIEQDSDIVIFLYRDVVYNEATEFPNQADLIVAKHRNGPTGTVSLYFDNALTKFMDGAVRRVDLGEY